MDSLTQDERRRIFMSELQILAEEEYITQKQYDVIERAYREYFYDLSSEELEKVRKVNDKIRVDLNEQTLKSRSLFAKPPRIKVEKSPEDLRERNITWSLNLGVILLLIGGLFVATSNWESMPDWMKSGSIGLVAILFFGISYLAKNVLKIEKTGLAFLVLGSLFLPIFLLSIGWFNLLGEYLSFTGEGRYIFGLLSSLALVPVYITIARKLSLRLFVWFSYLAMTSGIAYLLASLHLEKDWFYLGIMLYNALVVVLFHRFKKIEKYRLFTKELVAFAQIQLFLSSILTLFFYENHLINGINIIISAAVYLAMVYVSGRKQYHFVFSTMVVYGAIQIIEFSNGTIFEQFFPVFYVLVGIAFLAIPKFLDDQYPWKKTFQLTSAVVSCLVFFYITIDVLLINMNMEVPSWPLFLSYILLALQFLYLSNGIQSSILPYFSSVFWLAAFFEAVVILNEYLEFDSFLPTYFIGFLQFVSFGYYLKFQAFSVIRKSSRDAGIAVITVAILLSFVNWEWLELGLMLCLTSYIFYIMNRVEDRLFWKLATQWLLPISLASGFFAFGEECRQPFSFYFQELGLAMNAVLGSIISFLVFFVFRKVKEETLAKKSFLIGEIFYSFAMILTLISQINEMWMRPIVLLGGIGLFGVTTYFAIEKGKIKISLYITFTALFLLVMTSVDVYSNLNLQYGFLITSIMIAAFWGLVRSDFKVMTAYFFVPFSILGIMAFLGRYPYDLISFLITILYSIGLLIFLKLIKWRNLSIVPLLCIFLATQQYLQSNFMVIEWKLLLTSLMGIVMLIYGKITNQKLFQKSEKGGIIEIDGYTIISFLFLGSGYLYQTDLIWTSFIPGLLMTVAMWLQRRRVPENRAMPVTLIAGVYILEPYYAFISGLTIPNLFQREVLVLPWVVVSIFLKRCLNEKYSKLANRMQWGILVLVSLALVQDGLESSTIFDALILGILSLVSMISGMLLRIKSYFFVGAGVLLLNVFLQTRPWWGNLPWWGYLLITGSILIAIASYNEWHKQKIAKGETTGLSLAKERIILWFEKWK
jgi:hypothetical protein